MQNPPGIKWFPARSFFTPGPMGHQVFTRSHLHLDLGKQIIIPRIRLGSSEIKEIA
ncbi:MAG: hypothetical protein E7I42_15455 [Pluralibacter gergoviae]|nr:hypothetical protein [Pluralibacter gergoviae]